VDGKNEIPLCSIAVEKIKILYLRFPNANTLKNFGAIGFTHPRRLVKMFLARKIGNGQDENLVQTNRRSEKSGKPRLHLF
jgi:hypothetical protein